MKLGDFSELAQHYHNRPAYSPLWLDTMLKIINKEKARIAEVGAGTGKLTKMLAEAKLNVTAVEPNSNMLEAGREFTKELPVSWLKGSGENTGLNSSEYDWCIMASSFHWTDPSKSLPEFSRILRPSGKLTILWNPRNISSSKFHMNIESKIQEIVPELKRVSSGKQNTKEWDKILTSTGDFKDCIFIETDHVEIFTATQYLGAWNSVNDIQAQAGTDRWKKILDMIKGEIGDMTHIEVPYKIRSWTVTKS